MAYVHFRFCWTSIPQTGCNSKNVPLCAGVKNVIDACRDCKVKQLIYNSPADVVYQNSHHIHNGDESLPYVGKVRFS